MVASYLPLGGIRVLDFGKLLPTALTTQRLQALGADVVKVEDVRRPDWIRDLEPLWDERSCQDEAANRAKRSIAFDFEDAQELAKLHELIAAADVLLDNALPGRMVRQGVDYAALRAEDPTLIVCCVTGYGQTGPLAHLPSHGLNVEALAGALPVEWNDGRVGRAYTFSSFGLELGAANAAMAIAASIACVRGGGHGTWIDVSCWDAAVEAHRTEITMSGASGATYKRGGRGAFYEVYECRDGALVMFGAIEQAFWLRFCEHVGRMDLAGEWQGGGKLDFGEDKPELKLVLGEIFATADASEWAERFVAWGVPGSEVLDIGQIMAHPHFVARGFVRQTGCFPEIGLPVRWHEDDVHAVAPSGRAPRCGEHRDEVLGEWLGR